MATLCGMRETMPGIRPPNTPTLASGYMNLVVSAETIRSQVMTMQIAPPITQPWVAAITGLESLWLTSGTAFHIADGGSLRSAPTQKAGPSACRMATWSPPASKPR